MALWQLFSNVVEDGTVVDLLDRTEITADTLVGVVLDLTEELQLKIKFWNVSLWLLIKLFFSERQ